MSHSAPVIKAEPRPKIGSRYSKRLRDQGRLPAIVYGHKTDPVTIHVDAKETISLLTKGTHVMELDIQGVGRETCLIKDLQFGYLGDNVIHVDFARVNLQEEVKVAVRLNFYGHPVAATKPGAIVTHVFNDIDVICKVIDIPGEIRVDISKMEDVFLIKDMQFPPNVRPALGPETAVARISFVAEEAVGETADVAGAAVVAAEPEVLTETKAEERKLKKEGAGES